MKTKAVIRALQVGLAESLDVIEHLINKHQDTDPILNMTRDQLRTLLSYSNHVHDEPTKHHLYDN